MPYPPNYGGVIDVYYKIWWLHRAGIKIHLHCFRYGREAAPQLEKLCESVHYYERKTGVLSNLSLSPYTARSRRSRKLRENLLSNEHPILFEVLHTCSLMKDSAFSRRKKIYRHSNIEHEYYRALARSGRGWLKKFYHYVEAWRLSGFERVLKAADLILAVNETDTKYFRKKYSEVRCVYLPSFHSHEAVQIPAGRGEYVLFHGNLSVPENYNAAVWLLKHVLNGQIPAVIAGLKPPAFLKEEIAKYSNVRLIEDPADDVMLRLISGAQVHLLYTGQSTGLKLKLLNVLFCGRYILCNPEMLEGTGLIPDESLHVATTGEEFRAVMEMMMVSEPTESMAEARKQQASRFSNHSNVQKLIAEVF